MAIQRRGDLLPGFDSETGKAMDLHAAEWLSRIKGMRVVYDNFTMTIRVYDGDKLRYEVMALQSELR